MKFCRSCGAALGGSTPAFASGGMPPPGPLAMPMGPMPGMPAGPIGGFAPAAPAYAGPIGGLPVMGNEPTMLPPAPRPPSAPAAQAMIACPRCGTQTPLGFAFCQQCGFHMQAAEPARAHTPSVPPPLPGFLAPQHDGPIDPHAGTLAQDEVQAGSLVASPAGLPTPGASRVLPRPQSQAGPGWGTAVLVNRDGSDGQRFPLSGEYLVVGRAGADIAFDDDRFLARQHARFERAGDGQVVLHPLDQLNGVFRKADAPLELVDGMVILVGREVLRFERLDPEEVKVHPLVRHGVALFGSPPREPWGRLIQIVPSGGYRDVRHLVADEVVLGREEGEIVFRDDAFMSRRHAALTWNGKQAQVVDLGSSNGTFIRLVGPTALKHGDHVRMGDQLLRLELGW